MDEKELRDFKTSLLSQVWSLTHAATTVQSCSRAFLARRECAKRRHQQVLKKALMHPAKRPEPPKKVRPEPPKTPVVRGRRSNANDPHPEPEGLDEEEYTEKEKDYMIVTRSRTITDAPTHLEGWVRPYSDTHSLTSTQTITA